LLRRRRLSNSDTNGYCSSIDHDNCRLWNYDNEDDDWNDHSHWNEGDEFEWCWRREGL
jgi:hypothetical protein